MSAPPAELEDDVGRLDGKVAIVTGASRGIGAAVARRFAQEGARVAVNHLPDETMEALAHEVVEGIRGDGGVAIAIPADVSQQSDVQAMVARVRHEFGDTNVLVANAAAYRPIAWMDIEVDDWDRTFAVNVRGAFLCARAVHAGMRRRGGGSIVTVSSVMAHLGLAGALDYVATKAALVGFTRSLAREIGSENIRINSVAPGAIRTEQEVELGYDEDEAARRAAERQSLPRRGYAEDLAGTFVYLASEDSSFVTGQVIAVDGGWANR